MNKLVLLGIGVLFSCHFAIAQQTVDKKLDQSKLQKKALKSSKKAAKKSNSTKELPTAEGKNSNAKGVLVSGYNAAVTEEKVKDKSTKLKK